MRTGHVVFAKGRRSFHDDLNRRVAAYFSERGLSERGNAWMLAKTLFWVSVPVGVYLVVVGGLVGRWEALGLWTLGGFFMAGIGFNVGTTPSTARIPSAPG